MGLWNINKFVMITVYILEVAQVEGMLSIKNKNLAKEDDYKTKHLYSLLQTCTSLLLFDINLLFWLRVCIKAAKWRPCLHLTIAVLTLIVGESWFEVYSKVGVIQDHIFGCLFSMCLILFTGKNIKV